MAVPDRQSSAVWRGDEGPDDPTYEQLEIRRAAGFAVCHPSRGYPRPDRAHHEFVEGIGRHPAKVRHLDRSANVGVHGGKLYDAACLAKRSIGATLLVIGAVIFALDHAGPGRPDRDGGVAL